MLSKGSIWSGLTRECNQLCQLKTSAKEFMRFIDETTARLQVRLKENIDQRNECCKPLFMYESRNDYTQRYSSRTQELLKKGQEGHVKDPD